MGREKIIDSNHFLRIKHYRLKKRGKLEKKITIESIYQKALKLSRKFIKILKGQLIQKCIRKISTLKTSENITDDAITIQQQHLQKLKVIDHIYASQFILHEFFTNYFETCKAECINIPINDFSFLILPSSYSTSSTTNNDDNSTTHKDEMNSLIHELFISKNNHNINKGILNKLNIFLDDIKQQLTICITNINQKRIDEENKNNHSHHPNININNTNTNSRKKIGLAKALFVDSLDGSADSDTNDDDDDDDDDNHEDTSSHDDNNDDDDDSENGMKKNHRATKPSSSSSSTEDYHSKVKNRLKSLRSATVDKYKSRNTPNSNNSNSRRRPYKDDGLSSYRPPDAMNATNTSSSKNTSNTTANSNNNATATGESEGKSSAMHKSSSSSLQQHSVVNPKQSISKDIQKNPFLRSTTSHNSNNNNNNGISNGRKNKKDDNDDDESNLHPSWIAKRKREQTGLIHIHSNTNTAVLHVNGHGVAKKIKFDD